MKKLKLLIVAMMALVMVLCFTSIVFADSTELTPTNKTGMFNVVTASIESEGGQETLVIALHGTGYQHLFKGTYEQAVENGTAFTNWIDGYKNKADMWEFKIPLTKNESFIPIVAISEREYQKYLADQTTLDKIFYPRQAVLDRQGKTLVTDDYNATVLFATTSNVKDFDVGTKSVTTVIGGPNSNNYSVQPNFAMHDLTYDKVTYPTVLNGAITTGSAPLIHGNFEIVMTNGPTLTAFRDKEPIEMKFHVAANAPFKEAGTEVVRIVTINMLAKTITIDGEPLTRVERKNTTISIVSKSNIKTIKAGKKLKKTKSFTVRTKASSGAKTTYKKTTKGKITVSTAGKVTLKKGLKKGKYSIKVKVSAAATSTHKAASKTITIKITIK